MTHHSLRLHAHRYARPAPTQQLERLRAQYANLNAKPVWRPSLGVYFVGCISLLLWGAIWVAVWSVLP